MGIHKKHVPGCSCCEASSTGVSCINCLSGTAPGSMQITIPTSSLSGCTNCGTGGGTRTIANNFVGGCGGSEVIAATSELCPAITGGSVSLAWNVETASSTGYQVNVTMSTNIFPDFLIRWRKYYPSGKPDCEALSSESISHISNGSVGCQSDGTAATLSAA